MSHNTGFPSPYEPLQHHDLLYLQPIHTTGALSFLHPTHAVFFHRGVRPAEMPNVTNESKADCVQTVPSDQQLASDIPFIWRSRDNRKGRHLLQVPPTVTRDGPTAYIVPKKTASAKETLKGIKLMVTCCPYWDISYLVAMTFFVASATWILNSFFLWLALEAPETEFPGEVRLGGGVSALIGATLFELDSVLLMIEAFNADRVGCFGSELKRIFSAERGQMMVHVSPNLEHCVHHQSSKSRLTWKQNRHRFMALGSKLGHHSYSLRSRHRFSCSLCNVLRDHHFLDQWVYCFARGD